MEEEYFKRGALEVREKNGPLRGSFQQCFVLVNGQGVFYYINKENRRKNIATETIEIGQIEELEECNIKGIGPGFAIKSGEKRIQHSTKEAGVWVKSIQEAIEKHKQISEIKKEDNWEEVIEHLKTLPLDDFSERKKYYEQLTSTTIEKLLNTNQLDNMLNSMSIGLIDEWKTEKEELLVAVREKELLEVETKYENEKKKMDKEYTTTKDLLNNTKQEDD